MFINEEVEDLNVSGIINVEADEASAYDLWGKYLRNE